MTIDRISNEYVRIWSYNSCREFDLKLISERYHHNKKNDSKNINNIWFHIWILKIIWYRFREYKIEDKQEWIILHPSFHDYMKHYASAKIKILLHIYKFHIKKHLLEYIESCSDQNLVDVYYIYIYIYHLDFVKNDEWCLILKFIKM